MIKRVASGQQGYNNNVKGGKRGGGGRREEEKGGGGAAGLRAQYPTVSSSTISRALISSTPLYIYAPRRVSRGELCASKPSSPIPLASSHTSPPPQAGIAGSTLRSAAKLAYYRAFALVYGLVGACSQVRGGGRTGGGGRADPRRGEAQGGAPR